MRIALVTTQCPFVYGGAELHAEGLKRALERAGHLAEIVSIPFKWYPSETILDHILAAKSLDISEFNGVPIDLAICLKFPAYFVQHPNKVFWLIHQHRPAYDLWESGTSDLFNDPSGRIVRDVIRESDTTELSRWPLYANSRNVADRLLRFNGLRAEPLYHPPPLADSLAARAYEPFFFYPSRLAPSKRQDFVLRSLVHASDDVRVVFSGAPDNPAYQDELIALASDLGVSHKVTWRGFISDAESLDLYARARAILYTPVDEDLGYVALEAMAASKAIITLEDSGEPASLVRDGKGGYISSVDPRAFAAHVDAVHRSEPTAQALGKAARARYDALGTSWQHAVEVLTKSHPKQATRVSEQPLPQFALPPSERFPELRSKKACDSVHASAFPELREFGHYDETLRAYLETHWTRYRRTMDFLSGLDLTVAAVLDIGEAPPYVFIELLQQRYPKAKFTAVSELRHRGDNNVRVRTLSGRHGEFPVSYVSLNVETMPLPFPDESFDLVLGMEILEHFAVDPSFALKEMRRVLRPGGTLLLTTPNISSMASVQKLLEGRSPYSFGLYIPTNGVYGRHNREYAPFEVQELAAFCGFEPLRLETADVYPTSPSPMAKAIIDKHGLPSEHRGQTIFYAGRKSDHIATDFPPSLFHANPRMFSGRISVSSAPAGKTLLISNDSDLTWPRSGDRAVSIVVDRVDEDGSVNEGVIQIALPHDLEPGQKVTVPFTSKNANSGAAVWYDIDLAANGVGRFSGAGRMRTCSVYSESIHFPEDALAR